MSDRLSEIAGLDVVIIQPCLPHYRIPFFAELSRRLDGRLIVVAGPYNFGKSPVSVPHTPEVKRIDVRNIFVANRLAIQTPPSVTWSCPIAVLSFDIRTLSNLWLFAERRRRRLPTIFWGHGLSARPNSPRWVRSLRVWLARQADAVIFYSDKGKRDFVQLGVGEDKLFVAHNSIDIEAIGQAAARCSAERKDVLFIGRLIPAKKVDLLIQAFARALPRLSSDTRLIVTGDGPERSNLVALTRELGVSQSVEFVGEKTREEDLAPIFARGAVCVSPGYIGLSAIHSLAYGVPLLVADNEPHSPEIEAFVPKENGEYFAANDPNSLANRLVEMLAQPDRLREMGIKGQMSVQRKYSVQNMVDVFLQAFDYVKHHNP